MVRFFNMRKRQKYQRPAVFATGTREKLWKVRYREYFIGRDGKESFRNKSATWSRGTHTKTQAQAKADKLIQELQAGPPKADGRMTLAGFWDSIYLPIRSRKWHGNTPVAVNNIWTNHIEPKFGNIALEDFSKAMIELHLIRMVDAGLGKSMVQGTLIRLRSILEDALDNDFITKNPCRKVETPACKEPVEPRSLTEDEVGLLWEGTEGMDYLFWRLMILTGVRIGEVPPLERTDIVPAGLRIDEAIVRGRVKLPKREKIRTAALPESLRAELEEWLSKHSHRLIFPSERGKVYSSSSKDIEEILHRGRAVGIPDLTFMMCRTTFASLFEGDEADRTSIMGHSSTAFTLAKYRKPIQDRRQKSIEELDERLKVVRIDKKLQA
jgi:integrase